MVDLRVIDGLPLDKLEKLEQRYAGEKERRVLENRPAHYRPYPKQSQFHEAGATHRERLLMAANQSGKRLPAAWNARCTRPAVILIGGKANALMARLSAG